MIRKINGCASLCYICEMSNIMVMTVIVIMFKVYLFTVMKYNMNNDC